MLLLFTILLSSSVFSKDFLTAPFRITSEFLELKDMTKGQMLQNHKKLAEKIAPIQIAEAKKHGDVVIIKNKSNGKTSFYLTLEERMKKLEEYDIPGYAEKVDNFFAEKDLSKFYFIITMPTFVAKHKTKDIIDVCVPHTDEMRVDYDALVTFVKNELFSGDEFEINWKHGEFALHNYKPRFTHLSRPGGDLLMMLRQFSWDGDSNFSFRDEYHKISKSEYWYDWYPNRPDANELKMYIRNADPVAINDSFRAHPDMYVLKLDFPQLLKLLLDHGLNPDIEVVMDLIFTWKLSLIHIVVANFHLWMWNKTQLIQVIQLLQKVGAPIQKDAGNGENVMYYFFTRDQLLSLQAFTPEYHESAFQGWKYLVETYGIESFEKSPYENWWDPNQWHNEKIKSYLEDLQEKRLENIDKL